MKTNGAIFHFISTLTLQIDLLLIVCRNVLHCKNNTKCLEIHILKFLFLIFDTAILCIIAFSIAPYLILVWVAEVLNYTLNSF